MNTPLVPAIRLGADRVLVIGLRHSPDPASEVAPRAPNFQAFANPVFLFGKVLNALLLDHLETDLARMRLINTLLRDAQRACGPDFLDHLDRATAARGAPGYRIIDDLMIRPSVDLGALAGQLLEDRERDLNLPPVLRLFLKAFGAMPGPTEADLLSYLLFDAEFARPLVKLGQRDARLREKELVAFFSDEPLPQGTA